MESIIPDSTKKSSNSLADYLGRPLAAARSSWAADKARRNLTTFIQEAWTIVEPTEFVPNWHVDCLAEHLMAVTSGQIRKLLICVPPRHGKSLIVSTLWPSWEWITRPDRRFMMASYAESLAVRDNVRARRLIESAWYQANWGNRFQFASDQNVKSRIETDRGGHRIAVGIGGSITGEGGDRLVIDDPHNVVSVESDQVRTSTLEWFGSTWSTRANDPKTTAWVIIMQRSHEADLAGHVLEQGGWEHLNIPAEYEGDKRKTSIGWRDPRKQEGELLWPARFGPAEIESLKRTMGSYASAGQLQQRPAPTGGGIWKKEWFRHYRRADIPSRFDSVVMSWDCAFRDSKTSDFVCGQLWGRAGAQFWLLDQVHARLDFPATLAAVRGLRARSKWPIDACLIEGRANGDAIVQSLKHEIPGVITIEPMGGKEARAAAVAPLIEAGQVLLPMVDEQPWIEQTLAEFTMFPAARHDDRVDSASQALLRLRDSSSEMGLIEVWKAIARGEIDYNGRDLKQKEPATPVPATPAVCPSCASTFIQRIPGAAVRCGACETQFYLGTKPPAIAGPVSRADLQSNNSSILGRWRS